MPSEVAHLFDLDALIEITPWAVAGRYPEDIENPTTEDAGRIVDLAVVVLQSANTILAGN